MNVKDFKSVKDIIDFVEDYSTVYIEAKCKVEADFIQKEFEKLGVRNGVCLSENYPKHVGVSCENLSQGFYSKGFYSSGRNGNIESRNILTFNEFKSIVNGEGDALLLSTTGNRIQSKLKVIEHYLNGGDIQFFSDAGGWVDFTSSYTLETIRINEIRIKPKVYVLDGVSLTKDQLIEVVNSLSD